MPDLNFKQGIKSDLPEEKIEGNIYYTLDEDTFYIDRKYNSDTVERKQINANIAIQLANDDANDIVNSPCDGGKVFLDEDLWNAKPEGYTTITFTSDASNNTPINAVLFTEQLLEDYEIAQVKRNLNIQDADLSAYSTTEQIKDLINSSIDEAFDGIARAEGVGF